MASKNVRSKLSAFQILDVCEIKTHNERHNVKLITYPENILRKTARRKFRKIEITSLTIKRVHQVPNTKQTHSPD